MASVFNVCFLCLLSALTIILSIHAINFEVLYDYEASADVVKRFKDHVGDRFAILKMEEATKFVWVEVLHQYFTSQRKQVNTIALVIEEGLVTYSSCKNMGYGNYLIRINAKVVGESPENRLKLRITRLIYLETARILQWTTAGGKMKTSIGYYAVLKKKIQPGNWVRFKEGDDWNSTEISTAQFLEFCDKIKEGFVPFVNDKMFSSSFEESFFEEFFGQKVDVLWKAYKDENGGDGDKA